MATETISLGTDPGGQFQFHPGGMGAFFKFGAAPSSRMALMDLYSGGAYIRFSLNTDMTIYFEHTTGWNDPNLTSSAALSTGVWYWISVGFAVDGNQGTYSELYIHYAGGIASHDLGPGGFHLGRVDIVGVLGIGVPLSSSYLQFPNAAGWAWSKPIVRTGSGASFSGTFANGGALPAPTSDWTPSSMNDISGAWNNRETVGSTGNLADVTANNVPLIPAGQGLLVILDGPYP